MKRLIPVFIVMFLIFRAGSVAGITDLEAYNMLEDNPHTYLIDVRTVSEWAQGHPGSDSNNTQYPGLFLEYPTQKVFNLPLYLQLPLTPENFNPLFDAAIQYLFDPNEDILFFMCASGVRSGEAAARVVSVLSFSSEDVYNLGKYSDWQYISGQNFLPTTTNSNGAWGPIAAAVPLPSTLLLLGSGILGLGAAGWRRRRG